SVSLESWARLRGLSVQWFTGQQFATVTGPALLLGRAFGVTIDSYRLSPGRDFYAAAVFPRVPSALHGVVRAIGQITSYLDFQTAGARTPQYVPTSVKNPLLFTKAYNALPLWRAGDLGQGQTIVFVEIDGFSQSDLAQFSTIQG